MSTDTEEYIRLVNRKRLFGRSIFTLYLFYTFIRYSIVVLPICILVLFSACASFVFLPLFYFAIYLRNKKLNVLVQENAPISSSGNTVAASANPTNPSNLPVHMSVHITSPVAPSVVARYVPIPYVSKTKLPLMRLEDYFFISTIYLSAFLVYLYSFVLFLIWCPMGGIVLTISLLNSKEQLLLNSFYYLIGDSISMGFPDIVEFLIW